MAASDDLTKRATTGQLTDAERASAWRVFLGAATDVFRLLDAPAADEVADEAARGQEAEAAGACPHAVGSQRAVEPAAAASKALAFHHTSSSADTGRWSEPSTSWRR